MITSSTNVRPRSRRATARVRVLASSAFRRALACWALGPLLLGVCVLGAELAPGYEWLDLGNGVHVSTRTDPLAGPIDGNSTVIVTDRDVVVVDSHIDPAAARAVIARIREITPKPVRYLVNTHGHDDHTNGNHAYREAFPGVEIVAHPATLDELEQEWDEQESQRRRLYGQIAERDLEADARRLEAQDPRRAIEFRVLAGYRDALLPELDDLELVYPSLTIEDRLVLERGTRTIEILSLGAGNTEGDLVVWLPEERILITGDMIVHPIPFAFDAPMKSWPRTLERALDLEPEIIVPGHGAILEDRSYVDTLIELLDATVTAAETAASDGMGRDELLDQEQLEAFRERFAGRDAWRLFAWESFYRKPGLESAWSSID